MNTIAELFRAQTAARRVSIRIQGHRELLAKYRTTSSGRVAAMMDQQITDAESYTRLLGHAIQNLDAWVEREREGLAADGLEPSGEALEQEIFCASDDRYDYVTQPIYSAVAWLRSAQYQLYLALPIAAVCGDLATSAS